MKRTLVIANLFLITSFITGCSSSQKPVPATISDIVVSTTYDPEAKFPRMAYYAFLRKRPEREGLPPEATLIVRRIRDSIKHELKSKGYQTYKDHEIDYLVDYQIAMQHNISVLAERSEIAGQEWISIVGIPDDFVQGALVLDVIDVNTLKPVWRGVCNADIVLAPVSEEEKELRVRYVIQQLLKTFPPK